MKFKPMSSALPGIRVWGSISKGYTFVISHDDGTKLRPEDHAEWKGYTASYSKDGKVTRIDGLWQSFTAAEEACRMTLRQLKSPN